jgi:hypothetical protein
MNGMSGLIATPQWREFMDIALAKREVKNFPEPLAVDYTIKPILRGEIFDTASLIESMQSGSTTPDLAGVASSIHTILHYVDKRNPLGPYPSNPTADSQYQNWEYSIQKWAVGAYVNALPKEESTEDEDRNDEDEDEQ